MRIITGDECGLLKETIPELSRPKQREENLHSIKIQPSTQDGVRRIDPNEQQRRSRGVVDMTFTSSYQSFAALRANGSVQLWEESHVSKEAFGTYQCTGVVHNVFESSSDDDDESTEDTTQPVQKGRPIAIDAFTEQNRLCAADSLGNIAILTSNNSTPSVVASYSPFAKQVNNQNLSYTKGSYLNTNIATAMAVDSRGGRVAIGGRERETTLLDIETGDVVWKAKNLAPDPQTLLQHPIWSTALLFLDSPSASFGDGSNHVMATGTAFKQVRLYDVRTDSKTTRRPIAYTPEGLLSHRVTALCQVDAHDIVVGDAAGFLHSLDIRSLGKKRKGKHLNLARFVGPAGSIRQVVKHKTLPIIATVGLDRMLRTYDVTKRKQLDCVYLKQRLNCLLFCQDDTWSPEEEENKNVTQDLDDGDINAEDEVQDYVDSDNDDSGESSGVDDSDEEENSDAESADDDDLSDEGESGEDSEESEDEEESPQRHVSKRRRV